MMLPQERQSGLRAIIEIKIDVSRVIFEVWSSNLYRRISYEHKLVSGVNQSIGDHNSSWKSLRFINFQWSQRIVLLSYTTVCRIMFWLYFRVSTGSHTDLIDCTSAPQKKYFGKYFFWANPMTRSPSSFLERSIWVQHRHKRASRFGNLNLHQGVACAIFVLKVFHSTVRLDWSWRSSDKIVTSLQPMIACLRSEERRVGKECRSRWSPYH